MKLYPLFSFAFACLALSALSSLHANILIQDTFVRSTDGTLNGTSPTTDNLGSHTWVDRNFPTYANTSDGSLAMHTNFNYTGYISLGSTFFNENPNIYSLSMDINFESGSYAGSTFGRGFVASPNVNQGIRSPYSNGGNPWIELTQAGTVNVYLGQGTNNPVYSGSGYTSGQTYNLEIQLDTTQTNWAVAAYVNGTQLDLNSGDPESLLATFTTNPPSLSSIAIGTFGDSGTAQANLTGDNFSFASVPEPATYGMLLGFGTLLASLYFRRRR